MRTRQASKESAILQAAVNIFARQGFHKAKIKNIADEAGVATGSVYIYYKNKDAILTTIFVKLWEKLFGELKKIAEHPGFTPPEKLDKFIDILFDNFSENSALAIVFVNEQQNIRERKDKNFLKYYNGFMDIGENIVREGQERNLFNTGFDVKIIRIFVFGGLRLLLRQWAQDPEAISLNQICKNVKVFIKRGLKK